MPGYNMVSAGEGTLPCYSLWLIEMPKGGLMASQKRDMSRAAFGPEYAPL